MHWFIFLKKLFFAFLLLLSAICLYFFTAFCLTFFPANRNVFNLDKNQTIYLLYDKMHTDIVFDLTSTTQPWANLMPTLIPRQRGYIAFGWGDKETYLGRTTWDELKTTTALKALFLNTPSLMHVSYYYRIDYFKNLKTIHLSKEQQIVLEKAILKSFDFNKKSYKGYWSHDLFYSSPYQYNLCHTCNTWTGDRLRDANITISYWTPLSQNLLLSLP